MTAQTLKMGALLIGACLTAACGQPTVSATPSAETATRTDSARCEAVSEAMLDALEGGLHPGWTMAEAAAVRSDEPDIEVLYFLSARLHEHSEDRGIATWAAPSASTVVYGPHSEEEGPGVAARLDDARRPADVPDLALIWSVEQLAEAASIWRHARHPDLAYLGTGPDSEGAEESRRCVTASG